MDRKSVVSIPFIDSDAMEPAGRRSQYAPLVTVTPATDRELESMLALHGGHGVEPNDAGHTVFSDLTDHGATRATGYQPTSRALPTLSENIEMRPRTRSEGSAARRASIAPDFIADRDLERNGERASSRAGDDVPDDGRSERSAPEIRGALFQTKKTIAQGLLDIALLTANASQLKNLMETENHPNYTLCMGLLITSIILQILVAILLLVVGRMDYEPNRGQRKRDNRWVVAFNDISTAGIFFITVVNIFIASFIAHGKAYIPPVNAESAWNEKMYQQRKAWELTSKSNTSH